MTLSNPGLAVGSGEFQTANLLDKQITQALANRYTFLRSQSNEKIIKKLLK